MSGESAPKPKSAARLFIRGRAASWRLEEG